MERGKQQLQRRHGQRSSLEERNCEARASPTFHHQPLEDPPASPPPPAARAPTSAPAALRQRAHRGHLRSAERNPRCMSKPSKPAAATALEAELRELETQIQRIETVYLSRCGANLVQGEGRQREGVDGSRRRAATPACARDVILPPFLPGWANVVHLAGPAPSVPSDNWRSQVRHVAGALSCSAASPPALSERARHRPPFVHALLFVFAAAARV